MKHPLLFPALGLLAGTWLVPPGAPPWLLALAAASAFAAAWIALRRRHDLRAVLLVSLGLIPCGAFNRSIDDRNYESRLLPADLLARASTEYVDVAGSVIRLPRARMVGGTELDIAVGELSLGAEMKLGCDFNARIAVPASQIGEALPDLLPGDRVEMSVKLFATSGFRNPGAFDQASYLKTESIHHRGYTKSPALVHRTAAGSPGLRRSAALIRRDFSRRLTARTPTSPGRAVAAALILGERENLGPAVHESMRRSGLYHLLAISGGNFAMFSLLLFILMRTLHVPQRPRIVLVFIAMLFYAAMVEFEPSVMRSFVMIGVYLAGLFFERDHQLTNAVAIALCVSLVASPAVVADYGFQLTFLATGLLVAFAPAISRLGMKEGCRAGWLRNMTAVNITASVGLAPYLAYYFNRVTLAGLLLNYLAIPLSGIIMGIGFVYYGCSYLAAFIAVPTGRLLEIGGQAFLRLSDATPFPSILSYRIAPAPWWLVALFYVLLASTLLTRAWRSLKVPQSILIGAGWVVLIAWPISSRTDALRFTFIDVGQGDSILVDFPRGRHMLIDGGGNYDDSFDFGEKVLSPYLLRRGVTRIDYVVISHAHPDHINGLRSIVSNFDVGEVWEGINPLGDPYSSKFRHSLPDGLAIKQVTRGDRIECDGVTVEVLHPSTTTRRPVVLNNDSVVLRFTYAGSAALLPGDIEKATEADLVASGQPLSAILLKSPHHGSRTSSTQELLAAVRPQVVVVCVGSRNRWGLPHPDVLAGYRGAGAQVLRTDLSGAIAIDIDEHGWRRVSP